MAHPDLLLENIKDIYSSFASFCRKRGVASEADTRQKIIDRILIEVLGWPHDAIKLEDREAIGFLDYKLFAGTHSSFVIEAKKAGASWMMEPKWSGRLEYKLSGVISKNHELMSAIDQVQSYCNRSGTQIAVASNGYSFVIFKAISHPIPWHQGKAIVFSSPKSIEDNFEKFLEILSYENASKKKYIKYFSSIEITERIHERPLSQLANPEAPYGRNAISSLLHPYINKFFGDIAARTEEDILEDCYVYTDSLSIVDKNLKIEITDELPSFAQTDGFKDLFTTKSGTELYDDYIHSRSINKGGKLTLLMGGIGSGKSTYLKRFIKNNEKELSDSARFYYVNYLTFPDNEDNLEAVASFTYDHLYDSIMRDEKILEREVLELIFKDEIARLKVTRLYGKSEEEIISGIGIYLEKLLQDKVLVVQKSMGLLFSFNILPIIIFDNVDQLSLETQVTIFNLAQYLANEISSYAILSMREESYCTAQFQKITTAHVIKKYHIKSPDLEKALKKRISRATKEIPQGISTDISLPWKQITTDDIAAFFKVIEQNMLSKYKPSCSLLNAVSSGNMRLALNMLNTFMVSGATDVVKIIMINSNDDSYVIPFHEVVKSIILGEYKYYREDRSFLLNIFGTTSAANTSHFTGLRLLSILASQRNVDSSAGTGFVDLSALLLSFDEYYGMKEDLEKTICKFITVNHQLVELDTRRSDSVIGADAIRITGSGLFYLTQLSVSFQYVDIVWHDTPFNSKEICTQLLAYIHQTDMEPRFKRVNLFLNYLKKEELFEADKYNIHNLPTPFNITFSGDLIEKVNDMMDYIRKRQSGR